jgi:hypothetical protein
MSVFNELNRGRIQYFELVPHEKWSLDHFTSWVSYNFDQIENNNWLFYTVLYIIRDDVSASEEVRNAARCLLNRKSDKKVDKKRVSMISDLS